MFALSTSDRGHGMFSLRPRCLSPEHATHIPNLGRTRVALAKVVVEERVAVGLMAAGARAPSLSDGFPGLCQHVCQSAHAKSSA